MPDMEITLETTVGRAEPAVASGLDEETVVMDTERLRYHGLNATGSYIWSLLSRPMMVRDLCARVAADYDMSPEQCEKETRIFLDDMLQRNLVVVVDDADA